MTSSSSDTGPGAAVCSSATQLMSDVAAGDTGAFAQLYDLFADRVYRTARSTVGDPAQAEKVAQAVFLRVWRTASRFDPGRGSVGQWITAVTHLELVGRNRTGTGRRHCVHHRTGHPQGEAACRREPGL